jgi:hypothetical protein
VITPIEHQLIPKVKVEAQEAAHDWLQAAAVHSINWEGGRQRQAGCWLRR